MAKALKTILGALLLISSSNVFADNSWYGEVGYSRGSPDYSYYDLETVGLTVGKDIVMVKPIGVAVEASLGTGIGSFRIDSYSGIGLKLTTNIAPGLNLFATGGYGRVRVNGLEGSGFGWDFGAQVFFTNRVYGKFSYAEEDGFNGVGVGVGVRF